MDQGLTKKKKKLGLTHGWRACGCGCGCGAGVLGVVPMVVQSLPGRDMGYDNPITGIFGLLVSLWGIGMLEAWKRRQAELALEWGTSGERPPPPQPP